jgi:DNA polymerase I-like protein with 3'-5' exonuclease and polymerase domains
MKLVTLDFESHYSQDYSLSKLSTEEYIRHAQFEPLLVGIKVDDEPTICATGFIHMQLLLDSLGLQECAVLSHHAHFDMFILNHHFQIRPKVIFDTLSMARALHGIEVSGSLGKLAEHYGVGQKGTEVIQAKGKRLRDFTPQELRAYGQYCCNDVDITHRLFLKMLSAFPKKELKIIDMVVRMFTEPELVLDEDKLRLYKMTLAAEKMTLLFSAGVTLDEVMSNIKFAEALQRIGIEPPRKKSPTTGQMTFAFAKTDKGLTDLAEHPDEKVQALVAARLGNKTTINETRAERMANMAARGPATVYLKYSGAAQTHRLAGADGINWQNMQRGGVLRDCISAPPGKVLVVADSRNIEARVDDWLAMQEDAIEVYRAYDAGEGPDVYCVMASRLYGRTITPVEKKERQFGKVVKLACGYQMGYDRLRETARQYGIVISVSEAAVAIEVYRATHPMVKLLWARAQDAIGTLAQGTAKAKYVDPHHLLKIEQGAILLPNGMKIRYPELSHAAQEGWSFKSQRGERTKLYGGKIVENVVQALARIIVLEQTLEIAQHTPAKLSVHDEAVFCVDEKEVDYTVQVCQEVMSKPPLWAPDLPVAVEVHTAVRYGDCK